MWGQVSSDGYFKTLGEEDIAALERLTSPTALTMGEEERDTAAAPSMVDTAATGGKQGKPTLHIDTDLGGLPELDSVQGQSWHIELDADVSKLDLKNLTSTILSPSTRRPFDSSPLENKDAFQALLEGRKESQFLEILEAKRKDGPVVSLGSNGLPRLVVETEPQLDQRGFKLHFDAAKAEGSSQATGCKDPGVFSNIKTEPLSPKAQPPLVVHAELSKANNKLDAIVEANNTAKAALKLKVVGGLAGSKHEGLQRAQEAALETQYLEQLIKQESNVLAYPVVTGDTANTGDHCEFCGGAGELLCCDGCPATFHIQCLNPPLKQIPTEDWFCTGCIARQERRRQIKKNLESKKATPAAQAEEAAAFNCGYCKRMLPVDMAEPHANKPAFKFCCTCKVGFHRSCCSQEEALQENDSVWQCEMCVAGLTKEAKAIQETTVKQEQATAKEESVPLPRQQQTPRASPMASPAAKPMMTHQTTLQSPLVGNIPQQQQPMQMQMQQQQQQQMQMQMKMQMQQQQQQGIPQMRPALTPFTVFSNGVSKLVKDQNPALDPIKLGEKILEQWNGLIEEQRAPYAKLAHQGNLQAQANMLAAQQKLQAQHAAIHKAHAAKQQQQQQGDGGSPMAGMPCGHLTIPPNVQMQGQQAQLAGPAYQGGSGSNTPGGTPQSKERAGPKKALTPYMGFSGAMRNKMREEFPELSMQQLTQKIGERWSNMTEEEKIPFVRMADLDKVRYAREKAMMLEGEGAWSMPPTPSGSTATTPSSSKKDRIGPKKALTPYMGFSGAMRNKMREEFTDLTMQQLTQKIGQRWSSLSDEEKIPYVNMAQRDKVRYVREKAEFEDQQARLASGETTQKWVSASDRVGPGRFEIPDKERHQLVSGAIVPGQAKQRRKGGAGASEEHRKDSLICGLSAVPREHFRMKCKLCRDDHGAVIKCHIKDCPTSFHVPCAREAGLHMKTERGSVHGAGSFAFCPKHTRELKAGREKETEKKGCKMHECNVCGDADSDTADNLMYTCNGCHTTVHRQCYFVPAGTLRMNWLCDCCSGEANPKPGQKEVPSEVKCGLCTHTGGAMFRCEGRQNTWAHVSCALLTPNTWVKQSAAGRVNQHDLVESHTATHKAKKEKEELFCLCRTPYQEGVLMVGCDDCNNWYHPRCVGISDKAAEELDFYQCPKCKGEDCPKPFKEEARSPLATDVLSLGIETAFDSSIMQLEDDEDLLLNLGESLDGIDGIASPDFDFLTMPGKGNKRS